MPGLSNELFNRCRESLLKCSEFNSDASLRVVFVTDELYPFRDGLPEAATKSGRVDACLDFLLPKRLSNGQPILPLFLIALRNKYHPGDLLRDELEMLAKSIQSTLVSPDTHWSNSNYNLNTIRRQLNQTFDDPGLDTFCMDHFPEVYDKFGRGMRKDEKINLLLDHCRRTPSHYQELLTALEG